MTHGGSPQSGRELRVAGVCFGECFQEIQNEVLEHRARKAHMYAWEGMAAKMRVPHKTIEHGSSCIKKDGSQIEPLQEG